MQSRLLQKCLFILTLAHFQANSQYDINALKLGNLGLLQRQSSNPEFQQEFPEPIVLFEAIEDSSYLLGPGDFLTIGYGSHTSSVPVNAEGMIIVEGLQPIYVNNLSLFESKKIIKEKLSLVYKKENLFITLGRPKKIRVSITGAVNNPGLYTLNANSRVSELIKEAGGFGNLATSSITRLTKSGEQQIINLQDYYESNKINKNPYLIQGSLYFAEILNLNKATVQVREHGNIRLVQLREGETLQEFLLRYDSFKNLREWDEVRVFKGSQLIETINRKDANTYKPISNTILEIHSRLVSIFINGSVYRPGPYDFNSNFTALDYISTAGISPNTGDYKNVQVIDKYGKIRIIDTSSDRVYPGDHLVIPMSREAKVRDYVGLLATLASLALSVATLLTLQSK